MVTLSERSSLTALTLRSLWLSFVAAAGSSLEDQGRRAYARVRDLGGHTRKIGVCVSAWICNRWV